jgi:hypothetical protein
MVELPRRSVTRFFIPLIDVLTLLFCIFLLMPLVKATGEEGAALTSAAGMEDRLRLLEAELQRLRQQGSETPQALLEELERLRKEKIQVLQQRLTIQVLEIDPTTGALFFYDRGDRLPIANQAEAHALIERQKREAGGRELYYLFLLPRQITGFPEQRQVKEYERWFEGVAHGFDNPRGPVR